MSEWWTYRPSDFLMFAPRTYWRLFELHNEAWWPAQPLFLLAGLAAIAWFARSGGGPGATAWRVVAAGLAAAWAFVAWTFLLQRYAPINWPASGFSIGFFAQALVLAALAWRGSLALSSQPSRRGVALLLGGWALLAHPLLASASGRPLAQAEVFGLAPDPTALATLGFLLAAAARGRAGRALLAVAWALALAWCAVSAATLWTLGSAQAWVPTAAALSALAALGNAAWRRPGGVRAA